MTAVLAQEVDLMVKRRVGTFETEDELLLAFKCIGLGEGVGLRGAGPTYGAHPLQISETP